MKRFKSVKIFLNDIRFYIFHKILQKRSAAILMYHSLGSNKEFFTITSENFEWQMGYLKRNKIKVISLEETVNYLEKKTRFASKTVVLTFDDGYEDNYSNVFPILRKYNFPVTIFLTTGRIGDKYYTNSRGVKLPMMDWKQIKEMHDSGLIDFEPHTVNHIKLTEIDFTVAEKEILDSKKVIEEKLGKRCDLFAFPWGSFNQKLLSFVSMHFRAAVTVERGFIKHNDDLFRLKRNSIDSLVSKLRFKFKI